MIEEKDFNSSLYKNFFKSDDRKKEISISLLDKTIEEKKEYCNYFLNLEDSDLEKLKIKDIEKYVNFLVFPKQKIKQDFRLIEITYNFIEQIINIKDFNLSTDKHLVLQEKILKDYPILDNVIKYKQGRLDEKLINEEIIELAKLTTIEENEKGRLYFDSKSVFLSIEIKKAHNKLKNIEQKLDTEMNQTVVELAAVFEGLCKNIIEYELIHFKDICSISKGKKFDYTLLNTASSIEEIKSALLEEASTNATMGSIEEWLLETIKPILPEDNKVLKAIFSDERIDSLKELYSRRNIIVHNNSEINKLYRDNNKEYENNKNKKVYSDSDYLRKKIELVLESGIIMLMKFFEKKEVFSHRFGSEAAEQIGLLLLEEQYYTTASVVFKKQYKELQKYLSTNTPVCFLGYFNYCLSSLISDGKLPEGEEEKIVTIIQRLENNSEWFIKDPQMIGIAKTVLLQKDKSELLKSIQEYFDYVDAHIDTKEKKVDFKINFLSLPVLKLLEGDKEFIDYKYSLSYD